MGKRKFSFGVEFPVDERKETESKFVEIPDDDIDLFIIRQKAKTTTYKEISDLDIFMRFCKTIKENRNIECIPEKDLDNILCHFSRKALT